MAASTTLITDAETLISNGPSTKTQDNANSGLASASYPSAGIVDYLGMLKNYRDTLKSLKLLLTELDNITDAADPNKTDIENALLTLS